MTLNDSVRIPDQVASRKIGDETILLNLETGTYFGLDAVGSRFLELLEQNGDLAAAHRAMVQGVRSRAQGPGSRSPAALRRDVRKRPTGSWPLTDSDERRVTISNFSANNGLAVAFQPGVRQESAVLFRNAEVELGVAAGTLELILRRECLRQASGAGNAGGNGADRPKQTRGGDVAPPWMALSAAGQVVVHPDERHQAECGAQKRHQNNCIQQQPAFSEA